MKVLSLFDGISCGRVALERAELPVSRYVAYEIDKNAIKCSTHNWPDIEHRGSVIGADFSEFAGFDLVMGGFPCQDLSIAGKRAGLKGMRSGLFWYLVDAIETIKPRYFFVENNVGMPKEAKRIITETLGVEPLKINSALVSAQSRNRLYWTNIPNVTTPKDRGVLLSSILKYYSPDYYYLNDRNIAYIKRKTYGNIQYALNNPPPKSWCVCATLYKKNLVQSVIMPDGRWRELLPEECELLMGLPEGYTDMIPVRSRYRCLGNGWQVDTIEHFFNHMATDMLI